MKLPMALVLVLMSVAPATAGESLLDMLKHPSGPALAAVLADDVPVGDEPAGPADQRVRHRATRDIAVEPVSVQTLEITRGRDVTLPAYVNRD